MKTDALDRRSRFAKPQPVDRSIVITERDCRIFEAIDRHGKLSTPYLYELTKDIGKNYGCLKERLTKLYNGYCSHPHHGAANDAGHACRPQTFITRDWQQFNNLQARYQPAVYGITPLAKTILDEQGRGTRFSPERNDPFVHQFFTGCVSASFELGPHRFIFREEILKHERCPAATRAAQNPFALPCPDGTAQVPDDLFGIEYEPGRFRFFAVEIDRNTETIRPSDHVRNSIAKKVRGYTNILASRTYTRHLGLPNLTVLFATTNHNHMLRMIDYVRDYGDERYAHRFLFKAFPEFGENWRVPREVLPVFDAWHSTRGVVDISKKAGT